MFCVCVCVYAWCIHGDPLNDTSQLHLFSLHKKIIKEISMMQWFWLGTQPLILPVTRLYQVPSPSHTGRVGVVVIVGGPQGLTFCIYHQ